MKETKKDRVRSFKVSKYIVDCNTVIYCNTVHINSPLETWRAPLMDYQKATPNDKEIQ